MNIMSLDAATSVNITIDFGADALDASAFNGVFLPFLMICSSPSNHSTIVVQVHGAIRRALLAKANTDMDRWVVVIIATCDR